MSDQEAIPHGPIAESGGQRLGGDVFFAPFRLDPANGKLWTGATEIAIRPKTFAVLRHLIENHARLTTLADLVRTVWAGSHGSAPLVKGCIRELRVILGDDPGSPRYIETVGRRGYRFVAPLETPLTAVAPTPAQAGAAPFVGRRSELDRLDRLLAAALGSKRQVVFLSGEPGIGKTALAERFLNGALSRYGIRLGRGRCVERSGTGEPYLPILEALAQMCRGHRGEQVLDLLGRYAPTWVAELAALLSDGAGETLRAPAQGTTRERMLREMCEAAEALAAERPLIFWLDDLQWSDPSTIDLITHLASRAEPARLFLLGTYRPAEVVATRHPLRSARQGLAARGLCHDLALAFLTEAEVESYLALRFPANDFPPSLSPTVLEITGGNPLFLAVLLEELVTRKILVEQEKRWRLRGKVETLARALPDSLRHLIEQRVARLAAEDRRILETGSVAGREFAAGAVAAALAVDADEADARLESIVAHTHLVEARGVDSSPGRPSSGRYAFVHALHQRALYDHLSPSRRVRLHRRLGEAQRAAWGGREREIAAELALHFERGGDPAAAIRYLRLAAENAARKFAGQEAIALLERALELVERLPRGDRAAEELALRMALGPLLMTNLGYASPEVDRSYRRAADLSARVGKRPEIYPTLRALHRISLVRGDFDSALRLARKCLAIGRSTGEKEMMLEASLALGETYFYRGELRSARKHLEDGLRLRGAVPSDSAAFRVQDPGVSIRAHLAYIAALEGREAEARRLLAEGERIARGLGDPFSIAYALACASVGNSLLGDAHAVLAHGEAVLSLCSQHGFSLLMAGGRCYRGYGRAVAKGDKAGVDEAREGVRAWQATGARIAVPLLLGLLAEAQAATEDPMGARATVREAIGFARRTGERWWEAALARLEGELSAERSRGLRGARGARARREASAKLRQAVALARRQGATALVERAQRSLKDFARGRARDDVV